MRSRDSLAAHKQKQARRTAGTNRVVGKVALMALFVALASTALLIGLRPAGAQVRTVSTQSKTTASSQADPTGPSMPIAATHLQPVSVTEVSFKQLAAKQAQALRAGTRQLPTVMRAIHPPMTINDTPEGTPAAVASGDEVTGPAPSVQDDAGGPLVASPSPAQTFLGQEDGPKIGSTEFDIPPDTQGAVGIDKVFTNTNSNYRVHDKATGAALSTVSTDTFWAASGGAGFFDPRIVFDPINQRWILAMDSNPQTANSSIEIAVSQTSDPSGSYFMYRFVVGCANGTTGCASGGEWADFPMLGFNKNWIAVTMNMFSISTNANNNFRAIVLDYPQARAGTPVGTLFSGAGIGFCNHPAETYDATQNTLFLALHLSSGGATYRLSTITGTPSAPTFTIGVTQTRPGGGWTQPSGDILPQNCVTGSPVATFTCPATPRGIDVTDAQIRGNVVYRNGFVYYAQNVGLPAGTLTHVAVQWTKLDSSLPINVVNAAMAADGGRIEDPTATATNGGKWYAFPSVAVNKNNDMMIGFSQFASNQFASAGYAVRLHGDAAGTTRDPNIYKAGEDYYQKTFSGTRNRWGDYSATRIDPVNERDMWAIQEYAQQRVGTTGLGSNDSRWGTFWAKVALPAGPADLKIGEFRLQGPNGANDEFIEIYNNNNAPLTVNTTDGSAGYAVAASDGVIRFTIPNGTVIPGLGHYLGVNSVGYSLASYPAGNGTTATGDATYTTDIPFNAGIALFNTANVANFSTGTRLDAVGSTSEANTLYKEGAGYQALATGITASIDHSLYRDTCGKQGSISMLGPCPSLGFPIDTDNNAADFVFVDTNGTSSGGQQRLGAPGPENLSSPVQRNNQMGGPNLDATVGSGTPPNRVRDFTSDPANNSTFGTLDIRKRIINNTGAPVTRLRFRIIDLTTFPAPSGFADLRARTSTAVVVSGVNDPATCPGGIAPCTVTVQGTTLEQPPSQPNGGGFNSTLSAGTVALATPIANGQSINVRFLLGIQQTGTFKFFVNVEVLP
jgi:hypothetical protein